VSAPAPAVPDTPSVARIARHDGCCCSESQSDKRTLHTAALILQAEVRRLRALVILLGGDPDEVTR
jgi:hypothetical protein